jgi:hypothetical protein
MAVLTNSDPTTEKPPRRRRWIPLSLRMFAALLASLGIASVWLGARGYRQMVAIREIEQAGGELVIKKAGPEWLRARVGDEWMRALDKVEFVDFYGSQDAQALLPRLIEFADLETLRLDGMPVTDAELANVRGLTKLTDLSLDNTPVSDAGLEQLQRLTRLKQLSLRNTAVTDAGLKHLRGLRDLEKLRIESVKETISLLGVSEQVVDNPKITDSGLEHIAGLTRLELLSLRGAQVTDAGLSHLKRLTSLKYLWLDKTHVTDAGLAQLKGLTQLVFLSLRDTQITDAGLVHLKALPRLGKGTEYFDPTEPGYKHGSLDLDGTYVTNAGIAELQKALPDLQIWANRRRRR